MKSDESINLVLGIQSNEPQTWSIESSPLRGEYFGMACFGYGATRKMDESSLSSRMKDDPTESLFNDAAELTNPEEWLLQTDYSASKKSPIQKAASLNRLSVGSCIKIEKKDISACFVN